MPTGSLNLLREGCKVSAYGSDIPFTMQRLDDQMTTADLHADVSVAASGSVQTHFVAPANARIGDMCWVRLRVTG